jgi:transposase-like protein
LQSMTPTPLDRCPQCNSARSTAWGSARGRRRHRCCSCRRTFLAPSPEAAAGDSEKAVSFMRWILTPVPVRVLAQEAGIAAVTVHRWRRRVLHRLRAGRVHWCSGDVQLMLLGLWYPPWNCIVSGVDDSGRAMELWLHPSGPLETATRTLRAHIGPGSRLLVGGLPLSRFVRAAGAAGFEMERSRGSHPPRAAERVCSIRGWVRKFSRGPYRDPFGYIAWHDFMHGGTTQEGLIGGGGVPHSRSIPAWYATPGWRQNTASSELEVSEPGCVRTRLRQHPTASEPRVHPELSEDVGEGLDGEVDVIGRRRAAE